jgi:hypothetical protein
MTIGQRVAQVSSMTQAQINALGDELYQVGIITTKPAHGYTTAEVKTGLQGAFELAQQSGASSLSGYLQQRQANGLTAASTAGATSVSAPSVVQQDVYQAQDITASVNASAQRLLGRNATPQEIQDITNIMNQSAATKAQSQVQGDLSVQQQDIATKNAAASTTQNVTTPGTPQGQGFAQDLLGMLGLPVTQQNVAAIDAWHQAEGGNAKFNPLNTTQGASGASNYNSVGVKNYTSYQQGLQATAQTLQNGHYRNILAALQAGNNAGAVANAVASSPWGTSGKLMFEILGGGGAGPEHVPSQGGTQATTTAYGNAFVNPVGPGLKQGRTDQGVDFSGAGSLFAVGDGTIVNVTNPGWSMSGGPPTFIALKLNNPPDPQHSMVYYAEDINPHVQVGQQVKAGEVIGQATGVGSGIEIGWANPSAIGQSLAGPGENGATSEGQNFLSFIQGNPSITGSASTPSGGIDLYSSPVVKQVDSAQSAPEAADYYYMNSQSKEYQQNNLLTVFKAIADRVGVSAAGDANIAVRNTPVNMTPIGGAKIA